MLVQFFVGEHPDTKHLIDQLLPEDWSGIPYDCTKNEVQPFIFLVSPLWWNQHFIAAHSVWRQFLKKHHATTRLIVLGTADLKHSNYIDCLRPPQNLRNFLEAALTCNDEDYLPFAMDGLQMNNLLTRFFDGHGAQSFSESFTIILRRFRVAQKDLEDGIAYHDIWKDYLLPSGTIATWQKVWNRWQAYYPFFSCLPFYHHFKLIDDQINSLQPFFDDQCQSSDLYQQLAIANTIESINTHLTQAETYVDREV